MTGVAEAIPNRGYHAHILTGFWVAGKDRAEVWGRPTALAIAKDGALLVADDTSGTIWRITYTGPRAQTDKPPSTGAAPR